MNSTSQSPPSMPSRRRSIPAVQLDLEQCDQEIRVMEEKLRKLRERRATLQSSLDDMIREQEIVAAAAAISVPTTAATTPSSSLENYIMSPEVLAASHEGPTPGRRRVRRRSKFAPPRSHMSAENLKNAFKVKVQIGDDPTKPPRQATLMILNAPQPPPPTGQSCMSREDSITLDEIDFAGGGTKKYLNAMQGTQLPGGAPPVQPYRRASSERSQSMGTSFATLILDDEHEDSVGSELTFLDDLGSAGGGGSSAGSRPSAGSTPPLRPLRQATIRLDVDMVEKLEKSRSILPSDDHPTSGNALAMPQRRVTLVLKSDDFLGLEESDSEEEDLLAGV